MLPLPSTATHRVVVGQEMPRSESSSPPGESTRWTFQADEPPSGSVELTTSPTESAATHSVAEGQDTLLIGWVRSSSWASTHAPGPPVG